MDKMVNLTLVLLKPTAIKKNLCGQIISRFERSGLSIKRIKSDRFSRSVIEELYQEHEGKDFYEDIIDWMSSNLIIAIALAGEGEIIKKVRSQIGATDPLEAVPGTIRGDFASKMTPDNLVHASDSRESASRELKIFFPELFEKV